MSSAATGYMVAAINLRHAMSAGRAGDHFQLSGIGEIVPIIVVFLPCLVRLTGHIGVPWDAESKIAGRANKLPVGRDELSKTLAVGLRTGEEALHHGVLLQCLIQVLLVVLDIQHNLHEVLADNCRLPLVGVSAAGARDREFEVQDPGIDIIRDTTKQLSVIQSEKGVAVVECERCLK